MDKKKKYIPKKKTGVNGNKTGSCWEGYWANIRGVGDWVGRECGAH